MESDPLRDSQARIAPGTPRDTVRQLLGEPLYTSAPWHAELYAGAAVLRVWWRDMVVPIPTFTEKEAATLLVVYGPGDVVSGTAYSGPGCGTDCATDSAWGWPFASCDEQAGPCGSGDLQGLGIVDYQVLLAPAAAGRDLAAAPSGDGRCTVLVDVSVQIPGQFDVYLDGTFLQRTPAGGQAAFLRQEVSPGEHVLACSLAPYGTGPGSALPQPGHDLPGGKPRRGGTLKVSCSGGEATHAELFNAGGKGFVMAPACGMRPLDAAEFAKRVSGARLVIVPDPQPRGR